MNEKILKEMIDHQRENDQKRNEEDLKKRFTRTNGTG